MHKHSLIITGCKGIFFKKKSCIKESISHKRIECLWRDLRDESKQEKMKQENDLSSKKITLMRVA